MVKPHDNTKPRRQQTKRERDTRHQNRANKKDTTLRQEEKSEEKQQRNESKVKKYLTDSIVLLNSHREIVALILIFVVLVIFPFVVYHALLPRKHSTTINMHQAQHPQHSASFTNNKSHENRTSPTIKLIKETTTTMTTTGPVHSVKWKRHREQRRKNNHHEKEKRHRIPPHFHAHQNEWNRDDGESGSGSSGDLGFEASKLTAVEFTLLKHRLRLSEAQKEDITEPDAIKRSNVMKEIKPVHDDESQWGVKREEGYVVPPTVNGPSEIRQWYPWLQRPSLTTGNPMQAMANDNYNDKERYYGMERPTQRRGALWLSNTIKVNNISYIETPDRVNSILPVGLASEREKPHMNIDNGTVTNATDSKGDSNRVTNATVSKVDRNRVTNATAPKGDSIRVTNATVSKGDSNRVTNATVSKGDRNRVTNATVSKGDSNYNIPSNSTIITISSHSKGNKKKVHISTTKKTVRKHSSANHHTAVLHATIVDHFKNKKTPHERFLHENKKILLKPKVKIKDISNSNYFQRMKSLHKAPTKSKINARKMVMKKKEQSKKVTNHGKQGNRFLRQNYFKRLKHAFAKKVEKIKRKKKDEKKKNDKSDRFTRPMAKQAKKASIGNKKKNTQTHGKQKKLKTTKFTARILKSKRGSHNETNKVLLKKSIITHSNHHKSRVQETKVTQKSSDKSKHAKSQKQNYKIKMGEKSKNVFHVKRKRHDNASNKKRQEIAKPKKHSHPKKDSKKRIMKKNKEKHLPLGMQKLIKSTKKQTSIHLRKVKNDQKTNKTKEKYNTLKKAKGSKVKHSVKDKTTGKASSRKWSKKNYRVEKCHRLRGFDRSDNVGLSEKKHRVEGGKNLYKLTVCKTSSKSTKKKKTVCQSTFYRTHGVLSLTKAKRRYLSVCVSGQLKDKITTGKPLKVKGLLAIFKEKRKHKSHVTTESVHPTKKQATWYHHSTGKRQNIPIRPAHDNQSTNGTAVKMVSNTTMLHNIIDMMKEFKDEIQHSAANRMVIDGVESVLNAANQTQPKLVDNYNNNNISATSNGSNTRTTTQTPSAIEPTTQMNQSLHFNQTEVAAKESDSKPINSSSTEKTIEDQFVGNSSFSLQRMVAKLVPLIIANVGHSNLNELKSTTNTTTLSPHQVTNAPTMQHNATDPQTTRLKQSESNASKPTQRNRHVTDVDKVTPHFKPTKSPPTMNVKELLRNLKSLGIAPPLSATKHNPSPTHKSPLHGPSRSKPRPTPTSRPIKTIPSQIAKVTTPSRPKVFYPHDHSRMEILCFGDSLTAGYYNHGKQFHPYGDILQRLISYQFHYPIEVATKGIVGEMTHKQMTNRLPLVMGNASHPFDWVIILGGTNDILHVKNFADDQEFLSQLETVWEPRIAKDIERLHKVANERGAHTMLLTIPENAIEVWPGYGVLMKMRLKINQRLRDYAKMNSDKTILCDLASKLQRHSLNSVNEALLWDDHLHLTERGYEKMAHIILGCLNPHMPRSIVSVG